MDSTRFEADLRWLSAHFRFVSYREVQASIDGGGALPANAALLTFDDGFAECYTVARGLLLRSGIPALFFLTSSLLDNRRLSNDCRASLCIDELSRMSPLERERVLESAGHLDSAARVGGRWAAPLRRLLVHDEALTGALCTRLAIDESAYARAVRPYLTSDQVRRMASEGLDFGGHARVHRRLQNLDRQQLEDDIVQSCDAVAALTGATPVPFAFPYHGKAVRRDWLREIRRQHPSIGLFFDVGGLKREGLLVWHRVSIERLDEKVSTTLRRAFLRNLM